MEEIALLHRFVFAILILNYGRGCSDSILIVLVLVEDCLETVLVQEVQHARVSPIQNSVGRYVAAGSQRGLRMVPMSTFVLHHFSLLMNPVVDCMHYTFRSKPIAITCSHYVVFQDYTYAIFVLIT